MIEYPPIEKLERMDALELLFWVEHDGTAAYVERHRCACMKGSEPPSHAGFCSNWNVHVAVNSLSKRLLLEELKGRLLCGF